MTKLDFSKLGRSLNWTYFEGKTLFKRLWLSFDKRAEVDLRLSIIFFGEKKRTPTKDDGAKLYDPSQP